MATNAVNANAPSEREVEAPAIALGCHRRDERAAHDPASAIPMPAAGDGENRALDEGLRHEATARRAERRADRDLASAARSRAPSIRLLMLAQPIISTIPSCRAATRAPGVFARDPLTPRAADSAVNLKCAIPRRACCVVSRTARRFEQGPALSASRCAAARASVHPDSTAPSPPAISRSADRASRPDRRSAERQGDVEAAGNVEAEELGRRHADHFGGMIENRQRRADRRRARAELAPPEAVADHHRWRAATATVVGSRKQSSARGPHPQHREQFAAHPQQADRAHLGAAAHQDRRSAPGETPRKTPAGGPGAAPTTDWSSASRSFG